MRSPPPEEEGAAETMRDELTTTPIPRPPVLLGGGGRELRSKVKSRKNGEGWGEGVFKIWVYFSLSYSDLTGNKLN